MQVVLSSVGVVLLPSMSEPTEDKNYASFWPEAPMPTVLDLLPASTHDAALNSEGVTDTVPQRRRRSSSRYHQYVDDEVCVFGNCTAV